MRKWWPVAALIAVIILTLYGAYLFVSSRRMPRPVPHAQVKPAAIPASPPEIQVTGRIEARNVIPIGAPIEGKVIEMLVDTGQNVFEGQILVRIESSGLDSEREDALVQLERAKARVQNLDTQLNDQRLESSRARADSVRARDEALRLRKIYDRQQFLYTQGAAPRLKYERARDEYEQSQKASDALETVARQADERSRELTRTLDDARKLLDLRSGDLENVREQVGAGQVVSPVTGVVTGVQVHTGDTVNPSMTDMIEVATDLNALQVSVTPAAADVARLRPGMPALIEIAESAGEPVPGVIQKIDGSEVLVAFTAPNPAVRPGLSALVRFRPF